jgi:hypothetical protein
LYGAGLSNNYLAGSLGIGATINLTSRNLSIVKNITGSTTAYSVVNDNQVQSDVTQNATGFYNGINTANTTFTLNNYMHFDAVQGTIGASSTVNNQYGFRAASSLTGATNNFGFRGDIASGTGRWNLYMNGTAANYMNGTVLIGTTTDAGFKLDVNGSARFTGNLRFDANIRDNRDNNVIQQSASGVASNRDLTIGGGGYGRMMFTSKGYSFTTGTHPSLGAYGFYYNGETSTGAGNGVSIYFKAQTPSAANSNGGDFIIELPSGTGTGRQGSVIIGGTSPNASAILELSSTTKALLLPRMTGAQAEAIAGVDGLVIYANNGNGTTITSTGFWGYAAGAWVKLN